uniref:Tetratricopeptide repeat protein 29 n=1 Tax=Phallusia mammillata TaxID=59560 RepID=A0A6F9DIN3_9ASCI|nr:uncharacterized protein LOC108950033 [Phallusia mammillata]
MLYMIGCNLSRNNLVPLAVKVFECAVESFNIISARKSGMLDTDEVILMKIFYETGECWKKLQNDERAAESLQSSLNLSFHCGDLSFERKLCLSLSETKMKVGRYSEAAVGYLRALTILDDLSYVGIESAEDLQVEKTSIHNQLARVYVELKLYNQALDHALLVYKHCEGVTTPEILKMIGTLYDHLGNPESALEFYKKCYNVTENKGAKLSSVIECIVCDLIKLEKLDEALEYINKQLKCGSDNKDEFTIFSAALHKGDVFMLTDDAEAARSQFNFAMKLSQTFPDEYFCECNALCKIADSFSEEGRYMHALYECERALALARKSKSPDLLDKMQLQVAIHSQHSTSEKELSSALATLCANVNQQCGDFEMLNAQELKVPTEQIDKFSSCCKAIQVILHRLHQPTAACVIAEWLNQCIVTNTWTTYIPNVTGCL